MVRPTQRRVWEVLDLLGARAPAYSWHPQRVRAVLEDFPDVDAPKVAAAAADWLTYEAKRVQDAHGVLRTRFERAHAELAKQRPKHRRAMDRDLADYDRFLN